MDYLVRQKVYRLFIPWPGLQGRHPMGERQLSRLLKFWVVEAGLDPTDYSVELIKPDKGSPHFERHGRFAGSSSAAGPCKVESTARYLGLKTKADPIEVCRAFDIDGVGAHRRMPSDPKVWQKGLGDCCDERFDGSGGDLSQQGFEFSEELFDGVEVWAALPETVARPHKRQSPYQLPQSHAHASPENMSCPSQPRS